ncbi:CBS domain-containing protein [Flavobacterium sp. FlaQc-47]|uniref:CBS domain-containing protein n=1 Tax=Flavobacterium sp. FlaQc-47 TaxID=3374180 RepID=UPI003757602E
MNKLEALFLEIKKDKKSKRIPTAAITQLYGVSRRGPRVIYTVNLWLEKYELIMEPGYASANAYHHVEIKLKPTIGINSEVKKPKYSEAIPRVSIIKSSDLNDSETGEFKLVTVRKEMPIVEVVSLMLYHNFSQIPILSSKKDVYGLVSWKSIGRALALGKTCKTVADCFEPIETINYDEPLFKAIKIVLEKEVILVRDIKNEISGIVTATDIGQQFLILSEPFLLIEQIENSIRIILNDKLTYEDINKVLDLTKIEKEIKHLSDLTFGHYVRIFENENLFKKIDLKIDRVLLRKMLTDVNKIRNEVMHFSPEEMNENDLGELRRIQRFIQQIIENI